MDEQGQLIGLYNLQQGTLDLGGVTLVTLAPLENNIGRGSTVNNTESAVG